MLLAGSDGRMGERVRTAVAAMPEATLIAEVASGEQAIAGAGQLGPDVIVLDVEIAGVHAIIATRTISRQYPDLGIVGWIDLSESADLADEKALWMRQLGACCCVDDGVDQAEMVRAIRFAARGEGYLFAARGEGLLSSRLAQRAALSSREHEVLTLIVAGWTDARIAKTCLITPSTVRSHTVRICRKLGIADRAAAVMRGRELGLGRDFDVTTDPLAFDPVYHAKREEFSRALDAARRLK